MKYAFDIEDLLPVGMKLTAEVCGWALARAHARSGNPATIAGYLGKATAFDDAMAEFGARYADQTERDHAAFVKAIKAGRIPAVAGI
jgi:NAD(P)H-dependent flavin oxidoreductase YrpB (nitropropane dioxygenase family)